MCFSANASFVASAVLAIGGIVSLRKVQKSNQLVFASIPLLFSIQQFAEGIEWLALTDRVNAEWLDPFKNVFFFIAQVLWPFIVPFSIYLLEEEKKRRRILAALSFMGGIVGAYLCYCLFRIPVESSIAEHHILYVHHFSHAQIFMDGLFYAICTIVPPFISSKRRMKWLGVIILFTFLVSRMFFFDYTISIWCFFAAIMSLTIIFVMHNPHNIDSEHREFGTLRTRV